MNPRRSTHVPGSSMKIRVRWDRIALGCAVGVVAAGLTFWGLSIASDPVNEDPYNGVPQCTDEIADAGGICHGEPVSERSETTLPPCPTEDSDNCFWNAATMGNERGTSFVTIDGVTYYPEVTK